MDSQSTQSKQHIFCVIQVTNHNYSPTVKEAAWHDDAKATVLVVVWSVNRTIEMDRDNSVKLRSFTTTCYRRLVRKEDGFQDIGAVNYQLHSVTADVESKPKQRVATQARLEKFIQTVYNALTTQQLPNKM